MDASPQFAQYPGINRLLDQVLDPLFPAAALWQDLTATAALGRQPDPVPRLVGVSTTFHSVWLQADTYVRQVGPDWFLFLGFVTRCALGPQMRKKVSIGLDLGLRPHTVAVTSEGVITEFAGRPPTHLTGGQRSSLLGPAARALSRQLRYAAGRRDAEDVIQYLVDHGSAVFAEALTHRRMSSSFVHDGRDQALHDYHFSWLSQYLFAARIPFRRVDPAFTSLTCSLCGCRGNRRNAEFSCPACNTKQNAHVNAARNILQRGLQLPARHRTG